MPSQDRVQRNEASYAHQPGTGALSGPLRRFADRLDEVRSAEIFDLDQVARVLVELVGDEEFFGPLIVQIPSALPGALKAEDPVRSPSR